MKLLVSVVYKFSHSQEYKLTLVACVLTCVCVAVPESRGDRAKRLFRHYTVGSYDSFDAPR